MDLKMLTTSGGHLHLAIRDDRMFTTPHAKFTYNLLWDCGTVGLFINGFGFRGIKGFQVSTLAVL